MPSSLDEERRIDVAQPRKRGHPNADAREEGSEAPSAPGADSRHRSFRRPSRVAGVAAQPAPCPRCLFLTLPRARARSPRRALRPPPRSALTSSAVALRAACSPVLAPASGTTPAWRATRRAPPRPARRRARRRSRAALATTGCAAATLLGREPRGLGARPGRQRPGRVLAGQQALLERAVGEQRHAQLAAGLEHAVDLRARGAAASSAPGWSPAARRAAPGPRAPRASPTALKLLTPTARIVPGLHGVGEDIHRGGDRRLVAESAQCSWYRSMRGRPSRFRLPASPLAIAGGAATARHRRVLGRDHHGSRRSCGPARRGSAPPCPSRTPPPCRTDRAPPPGRRRRRRPRRAGRDPPRSASSGGRPMPNSRRRAGRPRAGCGRVGRGMRAGMHHGRQSPTSGLEPLR